MVDPSYHSSKVVLINFDEFLNRIIIGVKFGRMQGYPPYLCIRAILSCLKRIGLNREDIILIAYSGIQSWRTNYDPNYKTQLKFLKDKFKLNWEELDIAITNLFKNINLNTPFHCYGGYNIESFDIIASAVQYFKNSECIIVSSNAIFDQLLTFKNCKILSPQTKKYKIKIIKNSEIVNRTSKKLDTNLISDKQKTSKYLNQYTINNLLTLPEDIVPLCNIIFETLDNYKSFEISQFLYASLIPSIEEIYSENNKKIVTYSDSFKKKKRIKKSQTLDL